MPIYAYRCGACGHARDILQKLSDPVLTTCPDCGAEAFSKQVTAAGFQLKGSGWYVTDFRDGNKKAAAKDKGDNKGDGAAAAGAASSDGDAKPAAGGGDKGNQDKKDQAAASPAPAASSSPSGSTVASGSTTAPGSTSPSGAAT